MGKLHPYYTMIPTADDGHPKPSRDGVPREEDLALRALQPESRPKRGRKKVEEREGDVDLSLSPTKRQRAETPSDTADFDSFGTEPPSALFSSTTVTGGGQDEEIDRYTKQLDTWTETHAMGTASTNPGLFAQSPTNRANSARFGAQQFRWRLNAAGNGTVNTTYPQSAITPTAHQLSHSMFAEPLSAITPVTPGGKSRGRRRHGPAVSSAWPSASTMTGKFRGRPPSNRSVRDGPFSTFPANPKTREGPVIDVQRMQLSTPVVGSISTPWSAQLSNSTPMRPPGSVQKPTKRASLQLQVPERQGGTVRLATPTPSMNGSSKHDASLLISHSDDGGSDSEMFMSRDAPSGLFPILRADLVRCLASRFVEVSSLDGPSTELNPSTAKRLAEEALEHLKCGYHTSMDDHRFLADCVLWFGLHDELDPTGVVAARSSVTDLRISLAMDQHHDHQHSDFSSLPMGTVNDNGVVVDGGAAVGHTQKYHISWKLNLGLLSGSFSLDVSLSSTITATTITCSDDNKDVVNTNNNPNSLSKSNVDSSGGAEGGGEEVEEGGWKHKYLKSQQRHAQELCRLRQAVVAALF